MTALYLVWVAVVPSTAGVQNYPAQMQPAADYAQCVRERATALEPKSASVEEAINSGLSKCKGQRSRALSAVRARMSTLGLPPDTARQSAETMLTSSDTSLRSSLTQELGKVRSDRQGSAPDR